MEMKHWIARSERFYHRLLRLYPQAYRAEYEEEMLHLFVNQCQEVYKQQGKRGILALWTRTLIDVGKTVVIEHITDPQSKMGLLDAMPNSPLPWKGVLLVMIPGLLFFVSQIAQVTSTRDWFFIVFYRAAYFLILPVLLIWLLTRRFPVWGLIPLGILYKSLAGYSPRYLISKIPFFRHTDLSYTNPLGAFKTIVDPGYLIPIAGSVLLLCIILWYNARHQQLSRTTWKWLAVYGVLLVLQIAGGIYDMVIREASWLGLDWQSAIRSTEVKQYLVQMPFWYAYQPVLFILLVFTGTLFVRKHGELSFLLLLGYLIPTVIFGRYGQWTDALPFYIVSSAVVLYRFVVAVVAPIWLVRTVSIPKRRRAAAIPVVIAIISQLSLSLLAAIASSNLTGFQLTTLDVFRIVWDQLIIAAGIGLAITLYLPNNQTTNQPSILVATAE